MSRTRSWYSLRTSAARPMPCFPSIAIVRTSWVATLSSRLRTFSLSLSASHRLRPALPRRLQFLTRRFFILVISVIIFSFFRFLHFSRTLFLLPRPSSRLRIWSRETGSAIPSRVGRPIFRASADCGVYSRAPLLPPGFRDGTSLSCYRCRWNERFCAWVQLDTIGSTAT